MKLVRTFLPLALFASALAHPAMGQSSAPADAPPTLGAVTRLDGRVLPAAEVTAPWSG